MAFEQRITATEADTDELGHVNNAVWVRWIQDIATAHWEKVAPAEHQAAYIWVVTRHEIDYLRAVLPGETVTGRTWIEEPPRGPASTATWSSSPRTAAPAFARGRRGRSSSGGPDGRFAFRPRWRHRSSAAPDAPSAGVALLQLCDKKLEWADFFAGHVCYLAPWSRRSNRG